MSREVSAGAWFSDSAVWLSKYFPTSVRVILWPFTRAISSAPSCFPEQLTLDSSAITAIDRVAIIATLLGFNFKLRSL